MSEFGKSKNRKDGLATYCLSCCRAMQAERRVKRGPELNAQVRERRQANPEKARKEQRRWRSENIEQARARDRARYAADPAKRLAVTREWVKANPDKKKASDCAYHLANKEKHAANRDKWRAENRERYLLQNRRYAANRRTLVAATATVPFTVEQLEMKMSMWGDACWMCEGAFESIDHVKPLSKGGLNVLANLRPACLTCNKSKGAKWPFVTSRRAA